MKDNFFAISIVNAFIGLLFIGIGFLNAFMLRRHPNMNGFYSAIPKEKKKDVDLNGLVAFTKKGFIILGIIIVVLPFILKMFHFEEAYPNIMPFGIIIGIMIIFIKSMKYFNHNVKKNKILVYVLFGILIFIVLLIRLVHFFIV